VKKKMSPLSVIAVVGILLLTLSALWRFSHSSQHQDTLKIVVAARDLPPGVSIGLTELRYLDVPKQFINREMTGSLNDVVGRDTRTFIAAGEPVRQYMVFRASGGLSRNLAPDERALTLQLGDDALVDHTVKPDDRVDVLVVSAKDSNKYTKTICQLARVLMTAPKEEMLARHLSSSVMNKITLGVTAQSAEEITEASEVGKIRLVLRPKTSKRQDVLEGANQDDLLPRSAFVRRTTGSTQLAQEADAADVASGTAAAHAPAADKVVPLPPPPESPVEWLVQVISGSHKETVSVGEK
jgi:Flp pilus assembly protein CpaB